MLLKIMHETELSYSDSISETVMELRMSPRQEQDQHRLAFSLAIGPPTAVTSYFDWQGNTVHAFTITPPHNQVRIQATSVVETDRPAPDVLALPDRWPDGGDGDYTTYDYRRFGGAVVDGPALRDLVRSLDARPGILIGELAVRILRTIDEKFTYEKGLTNSASPITEVLTHGRGVCQDFTHLMIGIARAMNIPARYVSGFLHPDQARYRGYTQTHAWCELLFPSTGWVGFDPTNNCLVGPNFVRLAVGRDYRDVPPNKGVFKGNATESMKVSVHSEQLARVPAGLHAERIEPIRVVRATERPRFTAIGEYQEVQHQEQQQQQDRQQQQQQQQQQQ